MKIAICASGDNLDSPLDPRFGRCEYFVIVDSETMEFSAEPNPAKMALQGAGIQSAQLISEKGAEAVVAGNFGPNAHQTLSAAGIRGFVCSGGTVRDAARLLQDGKLQEVSSATVGSHFGMGGGAGRGGGRNRIG